MTASPVRRRGSRLKAWAEAVSGWPWYVQVALIYLAARAVSLAIFLAVARRQGPNPWYEAEPAYGDFINIWDSAWYQRIYESGYPDTIPRDESGRARENPWAFYALFPGLVRALDTFTGLGWSVLAPAVAVLAGLGAVLVIYRLFRLHADHGPALWGTVFVSTFPISPILQVPYAESLHLLLLAASLYLVGVGRYLAAIPTVVLMCLTRPAGLPFAVFLGVYLLYRVWPRGGPGVEPRPIMPVRTALRLAALTAVAGAAAVAWPVLAWLATGELTAYTDTETAWRGEDLVLFKPWLDTAVMLFGPLIGPLALALLAAAVLAAALTEPVRRLGPRLRIWCAAYGLYLLAFLHPQTSTFRLLLPLFPLALAAAFVSSSRAYRGTVTLMFVLLQIVWVVWLWAWSELPGGGDYPP